MDNDIVPDLLKKIKQDFFDNAEKSAELEKLLLLLKDGKATYQEAYQFATKIGGILSEVLQTNISSSILPDGKMHYNIAERILSEMLGENHKMVAGYSKQIQESLNKAAGVGLKTVIAPINQNRIDGLVNRLSHESSFDDVSWILGAPVVNFSQNVVDNHIKKNAEFHYKSGLKAKIIRTTNGKCCDWCDKLAGVYFYPKVDKNVFRRHDRCDCIVEYYPGDGKKQDIWSKKWSQIDLNTPTEYNKFNNKTGAIYGAWNNENDPDEVHRRTHAEQYYNSVRNRNTELEVNRISKNTGFTRKDIEIVYNHLFENYYQLGDVIKRFDADYDIAQSWERLFRGKNIQKHDLTLINHELMESRLMEKGMSYIEAHNITQKKYNYFKELIDWQIKRGDL